MSLLWVRTAANAGEWYMARNTGDMQALKRHRQQVVDAHGVKDYQAGIALRPVYQSLAGRGGYMSPKDAGFSSGPKLDQHGNEVLPWGDGHPLETHENWHHIPVTDVSLRSPIHATQDGVNARIVAHNLFHPGKIPATEYPGQEGTKGLGDPDVDPDSHDHAERAEAVGADESSKVPRLYKDKTGQLHVADGHHQVSAALLLKKPHIQARVWDENNPPEGVR
jgi:hypothetical protein